MIFCTENDCDGCLSILFPTKISLNFNFGSIFHTEIVLGVSGLILELFVPDSQAVPMNE
jgi:hypothetical protein